MEADSPDLTPVRKLVVVLHGYAHAPDHMTAVIEVIREQLGANVTVLVPAMATSRLSNADPNDLAMNVVQLIDAEYRRGSYDEIVLIGHSLGAVIARKVYIIACGATARAPFEPELIAAIEQRKVALPAAWSAAVRRIVLLAAMNRGWRVTHHLNLLHAPLWALGAAYGRFKRALTGKWHLIMQLRCGAEFMTNLRVQWIALCNQQRQQGVAGPLTIQLLGSTDDMVAPSDNVDLVSGSNFVYLDVPQTSHDTIIDVKDAKVPERGRLFALALKESEAVLRSIAVIPSDDPISQPDLRVKNVLFVIHGIRDAGYWTHKLARRIRKRTLPPAQTWATETSSYGYFPMLPFVAASGRRSKVEWLMDQYATALAQYPNADFHYVGHSNGTYLLAKALQLYRGCIFKRVVFAGSVVRCNYDWRSPRQREQVQSVLNFVASSDWVVAWFPKLFEQVRIQDLGSAGHDGFDLKDPSLLRQVEYVRGGHGAAIAEAMWDEIGDFIVEARAPTRSEEFTRRRSWWVLIPGLLPLTIWALIFAALFTAWSGWQSWIGLGPALASISPQVEGFMLACYLAAILAVLRRL